MGSCDAVWHVEMRWPIDLGISRTRSKVNKTMLRRIRQWTVAAVVLAAIALGPSVTATSSNKDPQNEIPIYHPRVRERGATPAPTLTKDWSPDATPAPSTNSTDGSHDHIAVYDGTQCIAGNSHGHHAVSVAKRGTFCTFEPICVAHSDGNCPKKQPGLIKDAKCRAFKNGIYGCVG